MSGLDLHHFTLSPRKVVSLHEFYRLVTSALFHADFMHIGMNMLSAVVICSMVEKHIGSISLIITTLYVAGIIILRPEIPFITILTHSFLSALSTP